MCLYKLHVLLWSVFVENLVQSVHCQFADLCIFLLKGDCGPEIKEKDIVISIFDCCVLIFLSDV